MARTFDCYKVNEFTALRGATKVSIHTVIQALGMYNVRVLTNDESFIVLVGEGVVPQREHLPPETDLVATLMGTKSFFHVIDREPSESIKHLGPAAAELMNAMNLLRPQSW